LFFVTGQFLREKNDFHFFLHGLFGVYCVFLSAPTSKPDNFLPDVKQKVNECVFFIPYISLLPSLPRENFSHVVSMPVLIFYEKISTV
jgi:hypothetical protein